MNDTPKHRKWFWIAGAGVALLLTVGSFLRILVDRPDRWDRADVGVKLAAPKAVSSSSTAALTVSVRNSGPHLAPQVTARISGDLTDCRPGQPTHGSAVVKKTGRRAHVEWGPFDLAPNQVAALKMDATFVSVPTGVVAHVKAMPKLHDPDLGNNEDWAYIEPPP